MYRILKKSVLRNVFKYYLPLICFGFISQNCIQKPEPGMVWVEGNNKIKGFYIDIHPVTVGEFADFVKKTNFKTEAEKFGNAGVFNFKTGEWEMRDGANWEYPFGKNEEKADLNHPVTQVSLGDAMAYCKWAKKRLPTIKEFEYAQMNGDESTSDVYSWGNEYMVDGKYKANFWQGQFPYKNTVEDGFLKTSPVGYFGKNKLGLEDMEGNVWQWCVGGTKENTPLRGGSFLCDPMVCHGFKIGGTSKTSSETSLCHVGFRCVKEAN